MNQVLQVEIIVNITMLTIGIIIGKYWPWPKEEQQWKTKINQQNHKQ